MAYTDIDKSDDYFNTVTWSGTSATQSITGVGFKPDFLWVKARSQAYQHSLRDVIRGSTKTLRSNGNNAEQTQSNSVTSFDSDGFTLGADTSSFVNDSTATYVGWNWLAGGTASSNTDGDITSSVSHNSTSGFSIGTYTGTGTAGDTVGHGLNANPDVLIVKERGNVNSWVFSHKGLTNQSNYVMLLNTTDAQFSDTWFNSTSPTTSVFSTNGTPTNRSGGTYVFYAFTEKKGYSKFGSYTGNGNADGTFVYTGFKPAWIMYKRTDTTTAWFIHDNKRNSFNVVDKKLESNASSAEVTSSTNIVDFVANGFKLKGNGTTINNGTLIYMAFAENPFVTSTGIPCTAR